MLAPCPPPRPTQARLMERKVGSRNLRIFRVDDENLAKAKKLWADCVQDAVRQRVSDLHCTQSNPANYLHAARKKAHWMWMVEVKRFFFFLIRVAVHVLTIVFLGPKPYSTGVFSGGYVVPRFIW